MPNVIADIAGQYKTLRALLKKMPDGVPISVGDMVDRGPNSKEVLDFFMNEGIALLGNHEHLMLDHLRNEGNYFEGCWLYNGGSKTLDSFALHVDTKYLEWLESLPITYTYQKFLVSHTFIPESKFPNISKDLHIKSGAKRMRSVEENFSIIWSRSQPLRRKDYSYQVAGHNSQFGLKRFSDQKGEFAICIDQSAIKVLTGIHLPSKKIYTQEYID